MVDYSSGLRNGGLAAAIFSTVRLPTPMGRLTILGAVRFGLLRQISDHLAAFAAICGATVHISGESQLWGLV